jgi:hypothetical protein
VSNVPPHPTGPLVPPPSWPTPVAPAGRRQWPMFAFLLVALLITLGVAIVGWFRPLPPKPPAAPTYTDQQVADAKTKVCAAYQKVRNAINASTARDRGTDPTAQLVFAINGQQAILTGSEYLRTTLSQQPATPGELAKPIRQLTDIYLELVVEYQNNLSDSEEAPTVHAADDTAVTVQNLCK